MNRRHYLSLAGGGLAALAGCLGSPAPGGDGSATDDTDRLRVEPVTTGLASPWAVEPLPDESALLVTERAGRLLLVGRDGDRRPVAGTPEVFARGQGGLLDATLDPEFGSNRWLYLTYSVAGEGGTSSTRVGRGRLDRDGARLTDFEPLYTARPFVESSGHFGSRAAFDPDGHLYVTVGDRQFKNFGPDHVAQRLDEDLGSVLRLHADGSIPDDNPFVDDPAASDAVYTYGNRNPQGLTVHPETGAVWESEFGERDGDEINVLRAGGNYGWPVADNSCGYGTNDPVGVSHEDREDVVAPVYGWPCGSGGFPPSGMTFHAGEGGVDEWAGELFVAGLASQYLARFRVDGREVSERDPLLDGRGWRIRDVAVGPESGALYAVVDSGDAPLVRITR